MATIRRFLAVAALTASLGACGGDDPLTIGAVVGTYTATAFTVKPVGQSVIDVLAAGGTVQIVLHENLTTTGSIHVPASLNGGLDASLAGTYALSGNTITFSEAADTFIRDVDWAVNGNTITGAFTDEAGTVVSVTLTKS
jgi:zinc transporter ZupT